MQERGVSVHTHTLVRKYTDNLGRSSCPDS
jgi:hypothetical protein